MCVSLCLCVSVSWWVKQRRNEFRPFVWFNLYGFSIPFHSSIRSVSIHYSSSRFGHHHPQHIVRCVLPQRTTPLIPMSVRSGISANWKQTITTQTIMNNSRGRDFRVLHAREHSHTNSLGRCVCVRCSCICTRNARAQSQRDYIYHYSLLLLLQNV